MRKIISMRFKIKLINIITWFRFSIIILKKLFLKKIEDANYQDINEQDNILANIKIQSNENLDSIDFIRKQ